MRKGENAGYQKASSSQTIQAGIECLSFKSLLDYPEFNPLPDDKILDLSKMKVIADDKSQVIRMAKFVLNKIENIVGKEENADYQHFLLFPQCFQKAFPLGVVKSRDCVVKS